MNIITDTTPSVWPACLNCYNDGRLVGQWVECTDAENVTLVRLHDGTEGPYADCEEIWCLDTENIPIDGEMGLVEAAEWGRVFTQVGPDHWPALSSWVVTGAYAARDSSAVPSVSDFLAAYQGEWESFRQYAEQLADETGMTADWPTQALQYFDWNQWTRDLEFDYTTMPAQAGGVFVFTTP